MTYTHLNHNADLTALQGEVVQEMSLTDANGNVIQVYRLREEWRGQKWSLTKDGLPYGDLVGDAPDLRFFNQSRPDVKKS